MPPLNVLRVLPGQDSGRETEAKPRTLSKYRRWVRPRKLKLAKPSTRNESPSEREHSKTEKEKQHYISIKQRTCE